MRRVRHTYECPLRWADMDMLGHINNVSYLDYVQEAREELLADIGAGTPQLSLTRQCIDFVAPLRFGRRPVRVDSWVSDVTESGFSCSHEIISEHDGDRVVHARATSMLAVPRDARIEEAVRSALSAYDGPALLKPLDPPTGRPRHVAPVRVRLSEIDTRGQVGDVAHFELFQEGRIRYFMDLHTRGEQWSPIVIARTDVEHHQPIRFRREAYELHSWVSHLGSRAFTIAAEIRNPSRASGRRSSRASGQRGEDLLATTQSIAVAFDPESQRSTDLPETQRTRLAAELSE